MSDRVPLEGVLNLGPESKPVDEAPLKGVAPNQTLSEMQDLNDLSVMMGFDHGFDGESAEFIYNWAKSYTGEPGGPKVLAHIKETIRMIGSTERGPRLLKKLNMYATLDTKQSNLQLKKENLIT